MPCHPVSPGLHLHRTGVLDVHHPSSSPLGRLWRTAGCGHLRSDAPKHARRRAGSIIDCQYCVTCIAPNKKQLRTRLGGGRNQQNMAISTTASRELLCFSLLLFPLTFLSLLSRQVVFTACETLLGPGVCPLPLLVSLSCFFATWLDFLFFFLLFLG